MPLQAQHHESPSSRASSQNLHGVPTPATPGIWAVSHRDIDRAQQERAHTSKPRSSFELVTDVTFLWSYPAKSAFVTGTFSNWETTVAMALTNGPDGPVWVYSMALPPGDYQYKCSFFALFCCLMMLPPRLFHLQLLLLSPSFPHISQALGLLPYHFLSFPRASAMCPSSIRNMSSFPLLTVLFICLCLFVSFCFFLDVHYVQLLSITCGIMRPINQ